jgi:PhoPQ-activated pathogenicity-related protein
LADDFESVDDYNDYLEYAESLSIVPNSVHNLIHDIDVENTKKIIDRYKEANKDLIAANASKIVC